MMKQSVREKLCLKALPVILAALLAVSMVPAPAVAFAAEEANAIGSVRGEQSEEPASSLSVQEMQNEVLEDTGVQLDTATANDTQDEEAETNQSEDATEAGILESTDQQNGEGATSKESNAANVDDGSNPMGSESQNSVASADGEDTSEQDTDKSTDAEALTVEDAVAYGSRMLTAAAESAVYDAENPNTVVEYGKYAPGTYTVTANLYVPASLNRFNTSIQAYTTNPANPLGLVDGNGISSEEAFGLPLEHMENNATLEVCDDDTLLLTIPLRNPVFTVQGIGSGDGVEVQSIETHAGEYGPVGPNNEVIKVAYESRISRVTFKITKENATTVDGSHGYRIMGCTAYPTILDAVWSDQELDLTVDFSAVPMKDVYVSDPVASELFYNGERQGVTYDSDRCVVVEGTPAAVDAGDYSVTLKPRDGYQWSDGTTDERTVEWSIQKAKVTKKYETVVQWDGTGAPTPPSAEEVNANFTWYDAAGNQIEPLEGVETRTFTGWNVDFMFAYVSWLPSSLGFWQYMSGADGSSKVTPTFSGSDVDTDNYDVETKAIVHLTMAPRQMPKAVSCVYNGQSQIGLQHTDGAPFTGTLTNDSTMGLVVTPWNDFTNGWFSGLQSRTFVDVGTYSAVLSPMETYGYANGYWYDTCTQEPREFSWEITPATLTATAHDVYIQEGEVPSLEMDVTGFVEGENASNAKGYVAPTVTLASGVEASDLKAGETCRIVPQGGEAANYQFEYVEGTLHVLPADTAATPRIIEGLVYNGLEQQGVTEGAGYTIEGAFAKDAGTYVATATLNDGCTKWADGSTDKTRTFEYSIAKAKVVATYQSEAIGTGDLESRADSPMFRIVYTGFLNGERPENGTVDDWVAPELYLYSNGGTTDTLAKDWVWDGNVRNPSFIPSGGSARNYELSYERGNLWVNSGGNLQAGFPLVATGLVYNGHEQQGVFVREHSSAVSNVSAVDAGTYTTMVVLDEDVTRWYPTTEYWHGENDCPGENDRVINVQWSIAQAPLHAQAKDATITAGDTVQLECVVEGFVNGESADSAEGYEAPTVSVAEGADLEAGKAYPISVSGGGATNYYFASYEEGTLTVLPKGKAADPTVATGLVYNGTEQRGVQENDAWTLSGDVTATDAGDYETVVTLNDGYEWADGTEGPKTCEWSIAKAQLVATYEGETIVQGQEPALEVKVEGFCADETAETAKDYKVPTISLGGLSAGDLVQGEEYVLTPEGGEAANYTFSYVGGKLSVSALVPGTYTITANLLMPGEYNPVIKGLDVYANSPDNPFADAAGNTPVLDHNASAENSVPSNPESMNATLIVGKDGTKTLLLPIKNPVFTTQDLGTCSALGNVQVERVAPADASNWSYGSRSTRISKMLAQLTDNLTSGVASYVFTGSELYAVPLDLSIKPSGDVALQLDVDYSSMKKVSDSTAIPSLNPDPDTGNPEGGGTTGGQGGTTTPGGDQGGTTDPDNQGGAITPGGGSGGDQGGFGGGQGQAGSGGGQGGASQVVSHLRAGTYTVTSNIWVSRESSGLPLSPHLTSSVFPPKDPASSNATLQVDASGRALLTIPIVIQDRIMTVQSIAIQGFSIVASESSGGSLTSITVDLGVLQNPSAVITRSATVGITMGSLASTISGISGSQTWGATFEVNLSGVPTTTGATLSGTSTASGSGTIPAEAMAILSGQGEAVAAEADAAAEAALASIEDSENLLAAGRNGIDTLTDEMERNPWLAFGLGSLCTLVVGGAAVGGVAAHRHRAKK